MGEKVPFFCTTIQADRRCVFFRSVLLIGQILLHFSIVTWGASFTWEKQNLRPMHVGTCTTHKFGEIGAWITKNQEMPNNRPI